MKKEIDEQIVIPRHIAVIMDGNGRWAKEKGLPRVYGHREGVKRVKELVREAKNLRVEDLTIFAFSTENWDRPKREIEALFVYLEEFLEKYKSELMKDGIRLRMFGRRDRIPKRSIEKIEELESLTKDNKEFIFSIALDFGGRWDIIEAVRKIIKDCKDKKISEEQITEDLFRNYLSLGDLPSPDLLIRTSGEQRISNFLLWDLAYTEFYFCDVYWPDFDEKQFKKALRVYSKRERRFGKVDD